MATERLDITVRLNDASKAGSRAVKKNLSAIDQAAAKAAKSLKGLAAGFLGIQAIFAAGRGFANALKIFTEFDDAMRQVGAVTNATAQEFENLNDVAKELGATTRFTATQAAEGLKFLGLAGFEAAEAIAAIPDVLNLAAAGSLELGQAADITTNILAGFGLEVEQLSRVNDVLVKTFTSSNNNLVEIGEAFKLVGPIAKGVGADFEDLLATIGKLGDAGLKASIGGTTLRGTLAALFNPTKQEAKLMEELSERIGGVGLQIKDAEGNFIGFVDIIKQLEQAGLRGEEALKLFGLRAGPGVAALLNQGSVALEELRDGLRDAGGVADEIAEKMEAGIGGASRELAASFEALKISFIETFGDEIIKGIDSLAQGFRIVAAVIKENAFIFEFWAKIAVKSLRLVGGIIGEVTDKFNKLGKILGLVAFALTSTPRRTKNDLKVIQDELDDIFNRNKDKDPIKIPAELEFFGDEFIKDLEDFAGPAGPIGKGAKKVGDTIVENMIQPASIESRLKSAFIILRSELDKESAKIESEYKRGIIDLDQYFEEREVIVRTQLAKEVELLKQKLKTEEDLSKREIIGATISAKETQLQKELISLEQEKFQEFKKLQKAKEQELDKRLAKQKVLAQQELQADKILNDIKFRNAQLSATTLEAVQANELAKLDQRHQEELQRFTKFTDDKAKIADLARQQEIEKDKLLFEQQKRLDEQKLQADELLNRLKTEIALTPSREADFPLFEIEKVKEAHANELLLLDQKQEEELRRFKKFTDDKARIAEFALQQQLQKDKLLAEQQKDLIDEKIKREEESARLISNFANDVFVIAGSKSKELFEISKAAAIAEATISTWNAANKALSQGGFFGFAMAAAVVAQGLANVARIQAQSLAEGGSVLGSSPTSKSDNISINATAGEFMQPVAAVQHFGLPFMEAVRKGASNEVLMGFLSNRSDMGNFTFPKSSSSRSLNFADGGIIPQGMGASGMNITLINQGDPLKVTQAQPRFDGKKEVIEIVLEAFQNNTDNLTSTLTSVLSRG